MASTVPGQPPASPPLGHPCPQLGVGLDSQPPKPLPQTGLAPSQPLHHDQGQAQPATCLWPILMAGPVPDKPPATPIRAGAAIQPPMSPLPSPARPKSALIRAGWLDEIVHQASSMHGGSLVILFPACLPSEMSLCCRLQCLWFYFGLIK